MKLFLKTFSIVFLVFALFVFLTPFMLSTKQGKNLLKTFLGKQMDGDFQIESIHLNWFKNQNIQKISYRSQDNFYSFTIDQITIQDSLLQFIRRGFQFDRVVITSPNLSLNQLTKTGKTSTENLSPILFIHQLEVKNGRISLHYPDAPPLSIKDIDILIETPKTKDSIDLQLFAKSSYQNQSGIIDVKFNSKFDYKHLLETLKFQLFANIQDFPLEGVDQYVAHYNPNWGHLLIESIGPIVNLKGKITNIDFYIFDLEIISKYLNGKVTTQQGTTAGKIKGRFSPDLLSFISALKKTPLHQPVDFILTIQDLKIPSKQDKTFSLNDSKFSTLLETSPILINDMSLDRFSLQTKSNVFSEKLEFLSQFDLQSGYIKSQFNINGSVNTPLQPTQIEVKIESNPTILNQIAFSKAITTIKGSDLLSLNILQEASGVILNEKIKQIIGNELSFTQSGSFHLNEKGFSLKNAVANIKSPFIHSSFNFELFSNPFLIQFNTPLECNVQINKSNFPFLAPSFSKQLSLIDPLLFQLQIKPFKISKPSKDFLFSYIEAKAEAKQATLIEHYREQTIRLENLKAIGTYDQAHQELDIVFNSLFPYDQIQGQIESFVALKQFNPFSQNTLKESTIFTSIQGTNIPSVFLGPWINDSLNFSYLIGNTFSSNVKLSISPNTNDFEVSLLSDLFSCKASFDISQGIKLKNGAKINWTITPAGFKSLYLMNKDSKKAHPIYFVLNKDAKVDLAIDKFSTPHSIWDYKLVDPNEISLKGSLKIIDLDALDVESNTVVTAKDSTFVLNKKQNQPASFEFASEVSSYNKENPDQEKGSLQTTGTISLSKSEPLWFDLGNWTMQMQLKKFPTPLIDLTAHLLNISSVPPSLIVGSQLFGSLNAEIANQNGILQLTCNSSNASIDLNGVVINNKLMLKDPLVLQLQWSENLDKLLFNKASIYAINANAPVILKIDQRGFFMPLKGFNKGNIQAPHIILQLGKIAFYNKGNVNQVSSIFKLKDGKKMDLWFAPFYLKLQQGILDVERTEILIDNKYHVCTWGSINLIKEYVNLKLGLTAQSLSRALGIHGLPENYVLQIPLKGPYNNVSLDKGSAVAKIGLLIARTQSQNLGNVGTFINIFGDLLNDQSNIPPPKKPYPWKEVANNTHHIIKRERTRKNDKEVFKYSIPIPTFEAPENSAP